MKFQHKFRVRARLAAVSDFHGKSTNVMAITPPVVPIQLKQAPPRPSTGDEMTFTMWFGPVPVHWRLRVSESSSNGFIDHQLEGPFRYWQHRHTFRPLDDNTTEVVDEIHAGLRLHPLWGPVGLAMWMGLPVLFAYRAWKTRKLLEA